MIGDSELLPAKQSWQFNEIVDRYGFYILIALVFTGIASMIINPLANGYLRLIQGLLSIVF